MRYLLLICSLFMLNNALADYPRAWQYGLQDPATPIMEKAFKLDLYDHIVIIVIVFLILSLLLFVCAKFRKSNNPTPSLHSHNTLLEVAWTLLPVVILISIAIPSVKLLYEMDKIPEHEMNIKVVGHQWYWEYQYPDHNNITFDSVIIPDDKLQPGQKRLLEVDNRLVLPVNTNIRVLVTSADVIHSWGVPSFGVKKDAIPGKINETWININKPGIYYGSCYELCGINHGFMPISIEAKSKEDFLQWVEEAKKKFASNTSEPKSLVSLY